MIQNKQLRHVKLWCAQWIRDISAVHRPDNKNMSIQLCSHFGNTLIQRVDEIGTLEVVMGQNKVEAERLVGKGRMLVRYSGHPKPAFLQLPYLDIKNEVPQITQHLRCIIALQASKELPAV